MKSSVCGTQPRYSAPKGKFRVPVGLFLKVASRILVVTSIFPPKINVSWKLAMPSNVFCFDDKLELARENWLQFPDSRNSKHPEKCHLSYLRPSVRYRRSISELTVEAGPCFARTSNVKATFERETITVLFNVGCFRSTL